MGGTRTVSSGTGSVTTLAWTFAHFAPGERLVFEVDVDRADGTATVDATGDDG